MTLTMTIKICGLSDEPSLEAALDAGADMIGLVFHAASPRFVGASQARELRHRIGGRAEAVALTVDAANAELDEIVATVRPDWLQLHGQETPDRAAAIGERYGLRVMKAIPVREADDVGAAEAFRSVTDMILFDAKPPAGATRPGGHGAPFDWAVLQKVEPGHQPFMLSGGLSPGNVGEAIKIARPSGVDVSSGVESAPGRKDPDLIRAFIAAARLPVGAPAEALT